MNEKGKFIVIEGIGGSGKGTQIKLAEDLLKNNGLSVISTYEPGGIDSSKEIRKLIFTLRDKRLIGAEGQMVLFFAARKFWVDGVVAPNIDNGINVLTDRCHTSTGAYQGYAEGGDQNKIIEISNIILGNYKPNAVVFLDISKETSKRRRGVDVQGDPFDKEGPEYFDRLIAGYREMAKIGWGDLKWFTINGEGTPGIVSESIAKVLEDIFETKLQR